MVKMLSFMLCVFFSASSRIFLRETGFKKKKENWVQCEEYNDLKTFWCQPCSSVLKWYQQLSPPPRLLLQRQCKRQQNVKGNYVLEFYEHNSDLIDSLNGLGDPLPLEPTNQFENHCPNLFFLKSINDIRKETGKISKKALFLFLSFKMKQC